MTIADRRTIIEAIEQSDRLIPHIPGHNEYATISGVMTYVTPADDPMANKALLARLEPENADAAIRKVRTYFEEKNKSFSWIVGPGTTPLDLGSRLLASGFKLLLTVDGMYFPGLKVKINANSSVRVCELPVEKPGPVVQHNHRSIPILSQDDDTKRSQAADKDLHGPFGRYRYARCLRLHYLLSGAADRVALRWRNSARLSRTGSLQNPAGTPTGGHRGRWYRYGYRAGGPAHLCSDLRQGGIRESV
jgi:hypothetical protein